MNGRQMNILRQVGYILNSEIGKTDFWKQPKKDQDKLIDVCIFYFHSLSSTEEINNLKAKPYPSSDIYRGLKSIFVGLLLAPEAKSRRAITLLDKFKCFHPFLEKILPRRYVKFSYLVTRYLCDLFPDTYAKVKLPIVDFYQEEKPPSFTHFLAHTTKRKILLDALACPLPNSRYHVGTSSENEEDDNIYHIQRDLKYFVTFIRIGFEQGVQNSMYLLKPNPQLESLHKDTLPMLIPYIWFHLSKPTEYFSTLCVQYSFPNMNETEMIIIVDRINTALVTFHQCVVDTIHILDQQCAIIPDLIVEILKNIHLSSVQLFTHTQDSKYLHSLVASECKSLVDRSHKIKGVIQPAPLAMRKCRKRKL